MVTSAIATTSAGNEIIGGFDGTVNGSPSFVAHPYQIFYPTSNMGALQSLRQPAAVVTPTPAAPAEADLTGDDVLAEVISAERRLQQGITVNSGGINFTTRDNTQVINAQNQVDELNGRYTYNWDVK